MNDNSEFKKGDVVYLKNDIAQKSPILVDDVNLVTPEPTYDFFTGKTLPPKDPTPYWSIYCTWFNSQRKLEHGSFSPELLVKMEISG